MTQTPKPDHRHGGPVRSEKPQCQLCTRDAAWEYDYGPKFYRCEEHSVAEFLGAVTRLPQ